MDWDLGTHTVSVSLKRQIDFKSYSDSDRCCISYFLHLWEAMPFRLTAGWQCNQMDPIQAIHQDNVGLVGKIYTRDWNRKLWTLGEQAIVNKDVYLTWVVGFSCTPGDRLQVPYVCITCIWVSLQCKLFLFLVFFFWFNFSPSWVGILYTIEPWGKYEVSGALCITVVKLTRPLQVDTPL